MPLCAHANISAIWAAHVTQTMQNNITDKFALDSIDHDELLHFLSLYYVSAWRTRELGRELTTEIALPASEQFALRLQFRRGRISKLYRGPLLSKQRDLDALLEAIRVNCLDTATKAYGRGLLMVSRPVRGSYCSPSARVQMLPPTDDLPRPGALHGQHPLLLEFPIRSWQRDGMQLWRRSKSLTEWGWALNALLNDTVHVESHRHRQSWVFNLADRSYAYAQSIFPPVSGAVIITSLSACGMALPVVSAAIYYADWGTRARANLPLDELILPDDLDRSLGKFDVLQGIERHRFLSSAGMVSIASESWNTTISTSFIATVQAIECVAQGLQKSIRRWLVWSQAVGPVRRFRQICEGHGTAAGVDDKTLQQLYAIRSGMVHGESLFDVDRHPWGAGVAGTVLGLDDTDAAAAATRLAKSVLRDWLMTRTQFAVSRAVEIRRCKRISKQDKVQLAPSRGPGWPFEPFLPFWEATGLANRRSRNE